MGAPDPLTEVLREARAWVARPENDFTWSSWHDSEHALREIDGYIAEAEQGTLDVGEAAIIFLPTGPMQELALSSDWGTTFLGLASRFDAAAAGR